MKILLSLLVFTITVFASNEFKNCDQIIDKQVYKICYDYNYKGAKFVSYSLDGTLVNKNNIKERAKFYSEKTIPIQYRSKSSDYIKSGYDRGHLANDASFDNDVKVVRKTYTMANIIPQAPKVNRNTWIKTEKLERYLAVQLGNVDVLIGVLYDDNPKRIGKNQIAVPTAFYKKLYNTSKGYEKCFYYENDLNIDVKKDKLENHLVDCNTIHTLSNTHTQKNQDTYTLTHKSNTQDTYIHKKATNATHKYNCNTKKYCKDMVSCDEAMYYLNVCNVKRLDRDKDGVPCEKLCK